VVSRRPAAVSASCRSSCRGYFFFFQAEGGIRGFHVTGVQTCALPIYTEGAGMPPAQLGKRPGWLLAESEPLNELMPEILAGPERSAERRVGKGCRERGTGEQRSGESNGWGGGATGATEVQASMWADNE